MNKFQRFLHKVRSRLCLFSALALTSCGTANRLSENRTNLPAITWYVQATFIPGCYGLDSPVEVGPLTLMLYNVPQSIFAGNQKPNQLVLCFRVNGHDLAEQVRDQLMTTGVVEKITLIPNYQTGQLSMASPYRPIFDAFFE